MKSYWKSLSYPTKFSIIAFVATAFLGLFSMGFLGMGLSYAVIFWLGDFPHPNDWRGDWVWPAMISVGMFWSVGFLLGGIAWHYIKKVISSKIILSILYLLILWAWAGVLWYIALLRCLG